VVEFLEALTDDRAVQPPKGPLGAFLRAFHKAVGIRRAVVGPRRPTWSHQFETLITFLHHYGRRSIYLPLSWQRRLPGVMLDSELADRVTLEPTTAAGVPAEWIRPGDAVAGRVLFYLHGGGYSIGSIDSHRELLCRLALAGRTSVLAIDYRLAPEHPFPAQLDDSIAAYRWLLDEGIEPGQIVIAGDSAGGGLTISTLVKLRDDGRPLPAGGVCLSPWTELEARGGSFLSNERYDYLSRAAVRKFARRFATGADLRHPLAAPIYADLTGLPPLLIQAGGAESLLDDSLALARNARRAGVDVSLEVWPDMVHVWQLFAAFVPEGAAAIEDIGDFIRGRTRAAVSNVTALRSAD